MLGLSERKQTRIKQASNWILYDTDIHDKGSEHVYPEWWLSSLTFHCCLWEYNLCYLICEIEKLSGLRDSFVKIRGQWCKPQSITISYTRLHPTYTLTQTGNFTTTSLQHTSHGSCNCVLGNMSFNANYSFKPSCPVDKIQQAYQFILRTVVVRQRDESMCVLWLIRNPETTIVQKTIVSTAPAMQHVRQHENSGSISVTQTTKLSEGPVRTTFWKRDLLSYWQPEMMEKWKRSWMAWKLGDTESEIPTIFWSVVITIMHIKIQKIC
jgi:hypothetical protein